MCKPHTRVNNEVFPDPLGPMSRKEGKDVELEERYIAKWRSKGMERTSTIVTKIAIGVGPIKRDAHSSIENEDMGSVSGERQSWANT